MLLVASVESDAPERNVREDGVKSNQLQRIQLNRCVCVYPSLQHPDSSLSSEHVPLRAAVVSSLSEASPEALDHHSGSILALLQV